IQVKRDCVDGVLERHDSDTFCPYPRRYPQVCCYCSDRFPPSFPLPAFCLCEWFWVEAVRTETCRVLTSAVGESLPILDSARSLVRPEAVDCGRLSARSAC